MSMESWLQKQERIEQDAYGSSPNQEFFKKNVEYTRKMRNMIDKVQIKANHDKTEPTAENKELPCSEYTGGSVSYYKVRIGAPLSGNDAYVAECNDIIEALGMNYAEGNAFKAIWRMCAARTLGKKKQGYTDGLYDAEKVAFFGARMVEQQRGAKE